MGDEVPLDLDAKSIDRFLSSMGTDVVLGVLVGGQALAFWMDRCGVSAGAAMITNDGDALGKLAKAHDMAIELKAKLFKPPAGARTSLVAKIRIPSSGGKFANIDVLHVLYTVSGLRESSDFTAAVIKNSIEFEWRPNKFVRVMDPLDLLDSRLQIAAGLWDEKGPHFLTKAQGAIEVVKVVLSKLAAEKDYAKGRLGRKDPRRVHAFGKPSRSQASRRP